MEWNHRPSRQSFLVPPADLHSGSNKNNGTLTLKTGDSTFKHFASKKGKATRLPPLTGLLPPMPSPASIHLEDNNNTDKAILPLPQLLKKVIEHRRAVHAASHSDVSASDDEQLATNSHQSSCNSSPMIKPLSMPTVRLHELLQRAPLPPVRSQNRNDSDDEESHIDSKSTPRHAVDENLRPPPATDSIPLTETALREIEAARISSGTPSSERLYTTPSRVYVGLTIISLLINAIIFGYICSIVFAGYVISLNPAMSVQNTLHVIRDGAVGINTWNPQAWLEVRLMNVSVEY